jgi:hypothetical protein
MHIEKGFCQCGCGQRTVSAVQSSLRRGIIRGEPQKYIYGHRHRNNGRMKANGYWRVYLPAHSKADLNGYVSEHALIVERILGKILPLEIVIHHVDENGFNNAPANLVVCQDRDYHNLLHARMRALRECGHASWRKCVYCKVYDDLIYLKNYGMGREYFHQECKNSYELARYHQKGKI